VPHDGQEVGAGNPAVDVLPDAVIESSKLEEFMEGSLRLAFHAG